MIAAQSSAGRGAWVRVFLLALVAYAYFMPRWADWNIDSRLDLVHAIVNQASLRIDKYHFNTWDKAYFHGHYYSDKAPGTAVFGSAVYGLFVLAHSVPGLSNGIQAVEASGAWNDAIALGRADTQYAPAAKGRTLGGCQRTGAAGNVQVIPWGNRLVPPMRDWALSKYVVTIGVVALPSAAFLAFLFWFMGFFTRRRRWLWTVTLLYGFATVALPYATNFYSHQLVAATLFTGFALLFLYANARVGVWAAATAGFLFGVSFFTEYTVAFMLAVLGIYALWVLRRRLRSLAVFCAAGAIPVLALFGYNAAAFGNALDTGYSHDWCWSSAQAAGFAGFTYPHAGPLFDLTFGTFRGLFFMSPFLLLGFAGGVAMVRRGLRLEAFVCLFVAVSFIVAISAYWGWNGGRVDGPRYLVPMVPFLAFPIVFFLDRWGDRLTVQILAAVLGGISLFVTGALFLGGELFPESWLRAPLTQWSLPELAGNHIPPNAGFFLGLAGWESLLPLAALLAAIAVLPPAARRPLPAAALNPALSRR